MTKTSSKGNMSVLMVVVLIVIAIVASFLFTRSKYSNNVSTPVVVKPVINACKLNSKGDLKNILKNYIVKKGDSLLSIAKNELGDPSRYQEVAIMNGDRYPTIFSSPGVVSNSAFLEQGWTMFLPPDWIKNSSGQLDIINGMILDVRPTDKALEITSNTGQGGHYATLTLDSQTMNTSGRSFKEGDCITAVRDIRMNKVIKIDLQ